MMIEAKTSPGIEFPLRHIRHELNAALSQIDGAFQLLSSGNAKNPERVMRVHELGIDTIKKLLSYIDELQKSSENGQISGRKSQ